MRRTSFPKYRRTSLSGARREDRTMHKVVDPAYVQRNRMVVLHLLSSG